MFSFIATHKRLMMVLLLVVVVPPFAFFGMESYENFSNPKSVVAEVGGQSISVEEFENALQEQRERLSRSLGGNFDASVFDTPEARRQLLDQMINERLMLNYASKRHVTVTNEQVGAGLARYSQFLDNGKVSKEKLEATLRAAGISPDTFVAQLRMRIAMEHLSAALEQSAFVPHAVAADFARTSAETREIAHYVLNPSQFAGQVKITPADVEAYYKSHLDAFRTPEQVRADYVMLTRDALAAQISVSADEVEREYQQSLGPKIKARAEARKKAEDILAQLHQAPDKFAELAKQYSQDTGSAQQGGDLGFFGRGAMVKPFEDAVFKLKPGQISGIVESDFGFHIIRLDEIRQGAKGEERRASHILINAPAVAKDPASAKADIEHELKQQELAKQFPGDAESFKDIAYEQPDSLQPLADHFKLKIEHSGWLSKSSGQPPLDSSRVLAALFSQDVIRDKHNTEAIELAPGKLVVARVTEHKAASLRSLDEVRADIQKTLTEQKAAELAQQAGSAKLKALQSGTAETLQWSSAKSVSRSTPGDLDKDAISLLFRADASKLPAYVGRVQPDGAYALYRISKVEDPALQEQRVKAASQALSRLESRAEVQAFVAALREQGDVKIHEDKLQKKSQE